MSKKLLSATMASVLYEAEHRGGKLVRHRGGYWTAPNAIRTATIGIPFDWAGTSTVEALVARGCMKYVEWKEGHHGRFPIAAQVVARNAK